MDPVLPAHGGACIDGIVPALLARAEGGPLPDWFPSPVRRAERVVVLVLDGLGWDQLRARADLAPTLAGMPGGAITSVAPTTTATALTSLTTGTPPGRHGLVGYRVHVGDGAVLNTLRWTTASGDGREAVPPEQLQPVAPFAGRAVPAVIRAEFLSTAFTAACLRGAGLRGWRVPSTLVVEVTRLLREGADLVYCYYDGVDRVSHEFGLGAHYDAELRATDRLVADVIERLPPGSALLITADHGQVEVGGATTAIAPELMADAVLLSGEGRFRWIHVVPGATERVVERARALYGDRAWVHTRDELIGAGWFGPDVTSAAAARFGDVALVPFTDTAFLDPADVGEVTLVSRHGSLTSAEMWVPLLAHTA
jgi:predicted AlkP superfamily pyrophosphatase or phosphodiesterase